MEGGGREVQSTTLLVSTRVHELVGQIGVKCQRRSHKLLREYDLESFLPLSVVAISDSARSYRFCPPYEIMPSKLSFKLTSLASIVCVEGLCRLRAYWWKEIMCVLSQKCISGSANRAAYVVR